MKTMEQIFYGEQDAEQALDVYLPDGAVEAVFIGKLAGLVDDLRNVRRVGDMTAGWFTGHKEDSFRDTVEKCTTFAEKRQDRSQMYGKSIECGTRRPGVQMRRREPYGRNNDESGGFGHCHMRLRAGCV